MHLSYHINLLLVLTYPISEVSIYLQALGIIVPKARMKCDIYPEDKRGHKRGHVVYVHVHML